MTKGYNQFVADLIESEINPYPGFVKPAAAICFPNHYEVATANLGFSHLAYFFSEYGGFERFFYFKKYPDYAGLSFESGRKLKDFPIIAFSIPYEFDIINTLKMMDRGGVLDDLSNLRIAGGAAVTLNPYPFKPFFDIIVLGEGEMFFRQFSNILNKLGVGIGKERILEEVRSIQSVMIPGKKESGIEIALSGEDDLSDVIPQIISTKAHFGDMHLIDICRGCRFKCNFCASGNIRAKPLYREMNNLTGDASDTPEMSKVGLIGSIVSDHPDFSRIVTDYAKLGVRLGISSLRADMLDDDILNILYNSGVKSLTLAPEAGNDALRKRIGKAITDEEFIACARRISKLGFNSIKLYFMIGLPGESNDDIHSITTLCGRILKALNSTRLQVSISVFTPKAHTPFQFAPFMSNEFYRERTGILRQELTKLKCRFSISGYREAFISALLSLGDKRIGEIMKTFAIEGKNLKSELKRQKIDFESLLFSEKDLDYRFPWDKIKGVFSKGSLYSRYERARKNPT
ncbi:MAG: radical SAM protein [candidate division Zixibacteria bacterium]|nr:radical SAM protein [candidate division Zixibacteria bacterium]